MNELRKLAIVVLAGIASSLQIANAAPPIANGDSRTVTMNGTITINVLANDFDDDNDALSVTNVSSPANGSVSLNSDSSIRYTPDRDFAGSDSFTYTVSDTNGEVSSATVTLSVVDVELQALGHGDNARSIGAAIDDLCPRLRQLGTADLGTGGAQLLARCEALLEQARTDPGSADEALRQIAPEEVSAQIRQASEIFRSQIQAVAQRQLYLASGHSSSTFNGYAFTSDRQRGGAAGDTDSAYSPLSFFASALAGNSDRDRTELEAGYDSSAQGLTLGADYRFNNDFFIGAAWGWTQNDLEFQDRGGEVDATTYSLLAYAVMHRGSWSFDAQLGYGTVEYDTKRRIAYTNLSETLNAVAKGSTSGSQWTASAQAQYDFNVDAYSLRPFIRADYLSTQIDAFGENNAGGWEVEISEQEIQQVVMAAGVDASFAISQSWGVLLPQAHLSARSDVKTSRDDVYGRFSFDPDPSNRFELRADMKESLYFLANLGVVAVLPKGFSTYAHYQHLLGYSDTESGQFSLGLRFEF